MSTNDPSPRDGELSDSGPDEGEGAGDPQPQADGRTHETPLPEDRIAAAAKDGEGTESNDDGEQSGDETGSSSRRPRRGGFVQWLKELPLMLAIAFVIAILLRSFVVQAFWIPSGSMEQTLHGCPGCTGDRILVNRMSYWFSDPEPGDIVVFESPSTWEPEVRVAEPDGIVGQSWLWVKRLVGAAPPAERDLVKRVIAVGGQTVQCCDSEGRVIVDGEPLDEPYIYFGGQDPAAPYPLRDFGPVTVPEGRLFVMGDHRNASADSRAHINDQYQGTIPVDSVVGRAFVILFPFDRFSWLSGDNPQVAHSAMAGPASIVLHPPVLALLLVAPLSGLRVARRQRQEVETCTP